MNKYGIILIAILLPLTSFAVKPVHQSANEEIVKEAKWKKKIRKAYQEAKIGFEEKKKEKAANENLLFSSAFFILSGLALLIIFTNAPMLSILGASSMILGLFLGIVGVRRNGVKSLMSKVLFYGLILPLGILVGSILVGLFISLIGLIF